jgi:hypothetical protein
VEVQCGAPDCKRTICSHAQPDCGGLAPLSAVQYLSKQDSVLSNVDVCESHARTSQSALNKKLLQEKQSEHPEDRTASRCGWATLPLSGIAILEKRSTRELS